jgi:hypothetical protein
MRTRRVFLETDQHGRLLRQPALPPNSRMEVIFLISEESAPERKKRRKPSPVIRGKGKILGDIVSPAAPPEDWEVLQ